jgi:putative transposase
MILCKAPVFCAGATGSAAPLPIVAGPPIAQITAYIEKDRDAFGVEPICRVLPIAPATYYAYAARAGNPDLASDHTKRHLIDAKEIGWVFMAGGGRYRGRKVWHQLRRDRHDIARHIL